MNQTRIACCLGADTLFVLEERPHGERTCRAHDLTRIRFCSHSLDEYFYSVLLSAKARAAFEGAPPRPTSALARDHIHARTICVGYAWLVSAVDLVVCTRFYHLAVHDYHDQAGQQYTRVLWTYSFARWIVMVVAQTHLSAYVHRNAPWSWFVPRAMAFIALMFATSFGVFALISVALVDSLFRGSPQAISEPGIALCICEVQDDFIFGGNVVTCKGAVNNDGFFNQVAALPSWSTWRMVSTSIWPWSERSINPFRGLCQRAAARVAATQQGSAT
jgi:hypothetical protein